MTLTSRSRPRVVGAAIGALVGALLIISGLLVSALPLDGAPEASSAASGFVWIGLTIGVAALLAGALLGPRALGDRRATLVTGAAFIVGTITASLLLWGILVAVLSAGTPARDVATYLVGFAIYIVSPSIVAGGLWIFLVRSVAAGAARRSAPVMAISFAASVATVLVVSLAIVQPALGLY